jgi:thioesterase domain-containing protein/NAD(P)-dependent dehydrogenase (short-subunit alcohol dehydrogenase family)
VYLITGGLGGVGLTLADHLARSFQARLILVGRSALPLREQWDKWLAIRPTHDRTSRMIHRVRAMEALGAEVLVASADVANPCDVQNVVNLARKRFGRIDGVFHTAGLLQDGIIQLKDRGTVGRVLDPKVAGTLVLEEALTDPLDFMVLFSSVSALNGLPGQVDYAAANAFLDAFAHRSSTTGSTWTLSVNWSAWQEVGMAAAMARELGLVLTTGADGKGSERITHPLFVRRTHEADAERYAADLSLERTWILNEHRLRNRGVLPGTGYLELVRAAVALRHTSQTGGNGSQGNVEFRDVVFVRPFVLGPGEIRELQVRLGPALEFSVFSTSPPQESGVSDGVEHAKEHARGRVEWRPAAAPAALPLAAIRDRCGRRVEIVAGVDRERHMHFGARWNNLRTVHYGTGEALATLQLPEEFTGDLDEYSLHPALLDMATAGAQPLIEGFDAEQHFYVPFSYGRLVMHAALKPNCVSHITYKGTGTLPDIPAFDVTIADESGTPLVTISDFVMKRVHDTHVLADDARPVNRANRILEHSLRYGIAPAEGMSVLERILGAGVGPQVIVSPQDLRTFLSLHEAASAESETSDRRPEQRRQEGPAYEAPQTPTERRICKLLQDLLGIEQVGVRDNFFELGGHSLLAVRLFGQLHKSTGVNLPLATLFEAPTPRLLAGRFDDAASPAADDQGDRTPQPRGETAPTSLPPTVDNATGQPTSVHRARTGPSSRRVWSSLVALQPNGSRPPFFSIHGRGGNVLNYAAFVEHLGSDQPLYGLQCRGLDGSAEPFQSLPEMAAAYVEEIRTVQPSGPYFLGGGSMGGTVALEMAQQLQAKAERVALVAMFDTYGPHYFEFYAPNEVRGRSSSQALDAVRHHARKLQALSAREGYDYIQSRASARVHDKYKHWMCSVYRLAGLPLPHTLRYFALERLNVDMLLKYVPETYTGRIVLFRALVQPDGVYQEPMLGWSSIARGPFEVVNIPGTHNNLIEQPILGQRLRIALQQAQQAAESGNA